MPRAFDGPQLYLVIEATEATGGEALRAALGAASVASVLLTASAGRKPEPGLLAPLLAIAQQQGVAALVAADARLARILKADGVHLPWSKSPLPAYAEAREILGARAVVGADAGRSRHDAMQLGEAGADYIAFGIPPHVEDRAAAAARRLDLVAWWSEIFEVPVVAFDVESPAEAAALATAGADFIAAHVPLGVLGAEVQGWVREMAAALGSGARAA
jgi:thiamine-phosphate pyrophosphorylase